MGRAPLSSLADIDWPAREIETLYDRARDWIAVNIDNEGPAFGELHCVPLHGGERLSILAR